MRQLSLIIAAILSQTAGAADAALPAFPGAQGFGANAVGGRSGDVFHVTSLADTNTGSGNSGTLRYGLTHVPGGGGGRTIVFDVGGSIILTSNLEVKNVSNVTIAGQTAPGPGITIINKTPANNSANNFFKFQITSSTGQTTSNIIARYLTVRRGVNDPNATTDDAIGVLGSGTTENIILDHVTASWATDENLSITDSANKVTVQDSLISESLNPKGHAFGSLIRPKVASSVSFNHNLYADNRSRNPRPGSYNGTTLNFDFRNNVVHNWSDRAAYTGGSDDQPGVTEYVDADFVGNYFLAGPSTPTGSKSTTGYTLDTAGDMPVYVRMFQSGNKIDSNHDAVRDGADTGWGMFTKSVAGSTVAFPVDDATGKRMASEFAFSGLDYVASDSADDAYAKVLASAGGSIPGTRSAIDQRIIDGVTGTGGEIINAPDTTEWNNLYNAAMVSHPVGFDTDGDGMPNAWETARGLNPSGDDHTNVAANGYTNLENYLYELTLVATWNKNADASWSGYLNWLGVRPGATGATANFGSVINAPRTITVDAPQTVGQISFNNANAYTLTGGNTITMSVISGNASIDVAAGSHTITAPLALASDTKINVGPAASTLTISNLQPSTAAITKSGNGKLIVNNTRASSLNITGGQVQIAHAASPVTGRIDSLTIAGGSLDLSNNALVSKSNLASLIQSGAVFSSEASSVKGLAAVANASLGKTTFGGIAVSSDDVLVLYTWNGDANLSGVLDADDYFQIDSGYHSAPAPVSYFKGDFNYDGRVDGDDYALIDAAYSAQPSPGAVAVPEPASLAACAIAGGATITRRRRRGVHPPTDGRASTRR